MCFVKSEKTFLHSETNLCGYLNLNFCLLRILEKELPREGNSQNTQASNRASKPKSKNRYEPSTARHKKVLETKYASDIPLIVPKHFPHISEMKEFVSKGACLGKTGECSSETHLFHIYFFLNIN